MATAEHKTTGFPVPCPYCGAIGDTEGDDEGGGLRVQVTNLRVWCPGCDQEVRRKDLERMAEEVGRLLKWLDLAATV